MTSFIMSRLSGGFFFSFRVAHVDMSNQFVVKLESGEDVRRENPSSPAQSWSSEIGVQVVSTIYLGSIAHVVQRPEPATHQPFDARMWRDNKLLTSRLGR